MRGLDGKAVVAPASRHSIHVTDPSDLTGVEEWSRETLYRAVKFADEGEAADDATVRVVVLDYARYALYLARAAGLRYEPPRTLGLAADPVLYVTDPQELEPTAPDWPAAREHEATSVAVSPQFDVLVPAFDWSELDEDDLPPEVTYRSSTSSSGAGTGTPG